MGKRRKFPSNLGEFWTRIRAQKAEGSCNIWNQVARIIIPKEILWRKLRHSPG